MKKRCNLTLFFVFIYLVSYASIIISGDISENTTFYMSNNPHQISGTVRVLDGVTLTIESGVTMFFMQNSLLQIEGTVIAIGNSGLPITFSSTGDDNFTRITLNSAENCNFQYCTFSRSSYSNALLEIINSTAINLSVCSITSSIVGSGIYINNSTVNLNTISLSAIAQKGIWINNDNSNVQLNSIAINGCQNGIYITPFNYPAVTMQSISLQNCSSYPIIAGIKHYHSLSGLQVSSCVVNILQIWDTNLANSYTLPDEGLPYYFSYSLNVNNGAVLTLAPGVDIKFGQYGKLSFNNWAALVANGSDEYPITFSSLNTNTWKGINFEANCSGTLSYCSLSGCGYPEYGYPEPSLSAYGAANLNISESTINGGTTYGIYISGSSAGNINLTNVNIQNCPWTGLYILNNQVTLNYSGLAISYCGIPIKIPASLIDYLDEQPNFTNNNDNRIYIHSNGYLNHNTTIRNWGYPYICEDIDINVNYVSLTINAGCTFQMGYTRGFYCDGNIYVNGTESQPVLFTRYPDSSQNWRGFVLNSNITAHFNYCLLEHCGSSNQYNHIQEAFKIYRSNEVIIENTQITDVYCRAIYIEGCDSSLDHLMLTNVSVSGCGMDAIYFYATEYNVSINGLNINGCNAYPLSISANWAHQLDNITLTNNAYNLIRFFNGGRLASQTLKNFGYPYLISGNYNVEVYYTNVTILPGTVFYLENERSLDVYGTLNANGTEEDPIVFSRPPDTTTYWQSIILRNNSSSAFSYCLFSFGGKTDPYGYDSCLLNNLGASSLSLQNCVFSNIQAQAVCFSEMGVSDTVQIENGQITNCGTDGFVCNSSNFILNVNGLQIDTCGRYPLAISPCLADNFQNLALTNNTNNFIRLFSSGYLDNQVYFPNFGYQYRLEVNLIGNNGSNVTFAPGCEFWIADDRILEFNGAVSAIGNSSEPIIFSRFSSSSSYWRGLFLNNNSPEAHFEYCQFLYAGQDSYGNRKAFVNNGCSNLTLNNCLIQYSYGDGFYAEGLTSNDVCSIYNLSIKNVNWTGFYCNTPYYSLNVASLDLQNIGGYPLQVSADLLGCFSNISFNNIGNPYILIKSTTQSRTATWQNFGLPYLISQGLTVNDGVTLNISAGTTIYFPDYGLYQTSSYFTVYGALNTLGTVSEPVIFRGMDDDPSSWCGLKIYQPDAVCNLTYTIIRNAGLDENYSYPDEFCSIYVYAGTVNLNDCTISLGSFNLIKQEGNGTLNLTRCQIYGGSNGIVHNNGNLSLNNCEISGCSNNGIYHNGGNINFGSNSQQWNKLYNSTLNFYNNTATEINAPYCWWGSVDSEMIDNYIWDNEEGAAQVNFEPWFDSSCQILYYYTLDIPTGLTINQLNASTLQLSWNAVAQANSYKVLVAEDPYSTEWTILQENIAATQLNIQILPEHPYRFYKVVAVR